MVWSFQRSSRDTDDNQLYFGIELEFAVREDEFSKEYEKSLPFWVESGRDDSVDRAADDIGVEWRFHPATWLWWCEHRSAVRYRLQQLRALGAESCTDLNCGLHIHFSHVLTHEHNVNFMQFLYAHPKQVLQLSRRTQRAMDEFSYMQSSGVWVYKDTKRPIPPHEQRCTVCRAAIDRPVEKQKNTSNLVSPTDISDVHEDAVNVTDHDTIEVRIFAGTLDISEFYGSLGFVKSVLDYTDPACGYNHEADCDIDKYKRWLDSTRFVLVKNMINKIVGVTHVQR